MNNFHNFIHESEYRSIGYDEKSTLPHYDNSIEILQFWSDGGYFIVRNNIFPITPGSIIIVNALETHYSNPSIVTKYNRNKLILSTQCFEQICTLCGLTEFSIKLLNTGGIQLCLSASHPDALLVDSIFQEATNCFVNIKTLPSAQAKIIGCAIRILTLFSESNYQADAKNANHIVHRMTSYINNQLLTWEEISLRNLCSHLHISVSYASHLFKQLTNKSVTQYSNDLRISEAKKLLLSTDLKIHDIAETLKFKDSTTFCKTFKKYTGSTPRHYRLANGTVQNNTTTSHSILIE